ncbi:hypothetical protein [Methanobacterium sp.]|uniref:hypothetical protein n=1 Tax=Methanobacterium sp. TaxID=2164 RepID=UPI003C78DBEA
MKNLKIVSILILASFTMSFMVTGVSAAKMDPNWQFHVKTVELNDTFTTAPSGIHIPEVSFDAQYNKNYLNLVSTEGNTFTLKATKPGITFVNIICTPWYHILIYPPVDDSTITDTYMIIIKK